MRARTDDDVDVLPIPLVDVAGVVVGIEKPVLEHQLVTRLIDTRSWHLVDERVHERLRVAEVLAGDGAAHRPLELPVPGGWILPGEVEIQDVAEGQLGPGQSHHGQRLDREPLDELQQSAIGRRILGLSNIGRSTRRPREPPEVDGFRGEQTRARVGEVQGVDEQRGRFPAFYEPPEIHGEIHRVPHHPRSEPDGDRAEPPFPSVVHAVPRVIVAKTRGRRIAVELEVPVSSRPLDREHGFPRQVRHIVRFGYRLGGDAVGRGR